MYDCLIELHDMNWRAPTTPSGSDVRTRCWLITHDGTFLPVICDFDVHLYGEGYGFAHGWKRIGISSAGCRVRLPRVASGLGTRKVRAVPLEWRTTLTCSPAADNTATCAGASGQTSSLMRPALRPTNPGSCGPITSCSSYFGMYEADPYCFATSKHSSSTTAPHTYAAAYRNRVWGGWLIVLANMAQQPQVTSLRFAALEELSLKPDARDALYDVHQRSVQHHDGASLGGGLADLRRRAKGWGCIASAQSPRTVPITCGVGSGFQKSGILLIKS